MSWLRTGAEGSQHQGPAPTAPAGATALGRAACFLADTYLLFNLLLNTNMPWVWYLELLACHVVAIRTERKDSHPRPANSPLGVSYTARAWGGGPCSGLTTSSSRKPSESAARASPLRTGGAEGAPLGRSARQAYPRPKRGPSRRLPLRRPFPRRVRMSPARWPTPGPRVRESCVIPNAPPASAPPLSPGRASAPPDTPCSLVSSLTATRAAFQMRPPLPAM